MSAAKDSSNPKAHPQSKAELAGSFWGVPCRRKPQSQTVWLLPMSLTSRPRVGCLGVRVCGGTLRKKKERGGRVTRSESGQEAGTRGEGWRRAGAEPGRGGLCAECGEQGCVLCERERQELAVRCRQHWEVCTAAGWNPPCFQESPW